MLNVSRATFNFCLSLSERVSWSILQYVNHQIRITVMWVLRNFHKTNWLNLTIVPLEHKWLAAALCNKQNWVFKTHSTTKVPTTSEIMQDGQSLHHLKHIDENYCTVKWLVSMHLSIETRKDKMINLSFKYSIVLLYHHCTYEQQVALPFLNSKNYIRDLCWSIGRSIGRR